MEYEDFIINYLNKEKKETIKLLMSTNLSSDFSLSTDFPDKIDIKNDTNNIVDEDVKEFNEKLNKKFENYKNSQVKRYIDDKLEIDNYFPYEQKNLRRTKEEDENNKDIYNNLKKLSDLNEKLKEYKLQNSEKETKINIKQEEDEEEEEENENEE